MRSFRAWDTELRDIVKDRQPPKAYLERGFEVFSSVVDTELRDLVKDRQLVPTDADYDNASLIDCTKYSDSTSRVA